MLGRARNTDETHVYIEKGRGSAATRAGALYHPVAQNALETKQAIRPGDGGSLKPEQMRLTKLQSKCLAAHNLSTNSLRGHFANRAKSGGYRVGWVNGGKDRDLLREFRRIKNILDAEERAAVLNAAPISDEEYERRCRRGGLTAAERAEKERHRIEALIGQTITPLAYAVLHTKAGTEALLRYTDLRDTDEHMQEADRVEERDNVPLFWLRHRTKQREQLLAFLEIVFPEGLRADRILTAGQIAARMTVFWGAYGDAMRRFFGMRREQSQDPVAQLRWMLGKIGLKLNNRQIRVTEARALGIMDKARPYVYWLDADDLALMNEMAARRLAHLERLHAERTAAREGDLKRVYRSTDIYNQWCKS